MHCSLPFEDVFSSDILSSGIRMDEARSAIELSNNALELQSKLARRLLERAFKEFRKVLSSKVCNTNSNLPFLPILNCRIADNGAAPLCRIIFQEGIEVNTSQECLVFHRFMWYLSCLDYDAGCGKRKCIFAKERKQGWGKPCGFGPMEFCTRSVCTGFVTRE